MAHLLPYWIACLFLRLEPWLIITCVFGIQIPKTASTAGKRYFERAPKYGIHHHPNRLSEEMVRCMASIYCWLCLEETKDRGKETLILSRSSTSTVRKHGFGDDCDLSTETMLEISCISTNKNPFSTTNAAIRNYRWFILIIFSCSFQFSVVFCSLINYKFSDCVQSIGWTAREGWYGQVGN